ncbi:hypothetical protein [Pedobacter sp. UC225_65]|uniref:hypothetical protein n=1 Tax=Pedobacter sp. UC225_65 TaxID=3350173 RepID=UPI0036715735
MIFIPGSNQEIELPQGLVKNRLKFYAIDNSFSINFRADRIDIECINVLGKPVMSCEDFCEKAKSIVAAIEQTHVRKANRLAFVTTYRNFQLSEPEKDQVYSKIFSKLTEISEVPPIEWNHRTCRRYSRTFNSKTEIFNNVYNLGRVFGVNTKNRQAHNFFELGLDINTNPENIGVRFSTPDFNGFLSEVSAWNQELLNNVNGILK